ncbi:MAG TPA: hypothetical protein PKZ52_09055, partial [Cellvibrionaceae bacterium]|nr:hypothetical protein [Cellvibrionaceae bacterium]
DLRGTQITALPENLSVGGYLDLRGTQITALPENLSVGGSLDLHEKTQNAAFKKNCGRQNRTIFAAWVNGEIQIGAGCFLGSIATFCEAVDESYKGEAADKYKADAQDCVDRLVAILNKE